jgi:predicted methyltransferase
MIAVRVRKKFTIVAFGVLCGLCVCLRASAQPAPNYAALIAAPDRSDIDRQADKRRDPVLLLAFAGVRPGMKVLDMGAGGGYSTELLARAVAPGGIVWRPNHRRSASWALRRFATQSCRAAAQPPAISTLG